MKNILLTLFVAFFITFITTPVMKKIALKYNIVDIPNQRKSHKNNTPYLGGVAIFIGSIISILFFAKADTKFVVPVMVIALFVIMLMGLFDDIKDLTAKFRLFLIFLSATSLILAFQVFNYGLQLHYGLFLNILVILAAIVWIVAITNAINWSDGLDGLAATQAIISSIGFALLFWMQGRTQLTLPIALSLVGALLGFLPFNLSPAKIFMGDTGSMFIGFLLGILSIISVNQEIQLITIIVPVYLILMPVLDMSTVIIRRKLNHKSMMAADKTHLHHILNEKFKNQKTVVLIIAIIQILFTIIGLLIYKYKVYLIGILILLSLILIILTRLIINVKRNNK